MAMVLPIFLIITLLFSHLAESTPHGPSCSVTITTTKTFKGHCVKLSKRGLVKIGCQAEGYLDPENDDCVEAEEIFG
jgi:hypothetical protein